MSRYDVSTETTLRTTLLVFVFSLPFFFALSKTNYLFFHSFTELTSVAISWGIFFIMLAAGRIHQCTGFLTIIGVASFFVGSVDVLHTLAYKGMAIVGDGQPNLPTQLWIAARILQALSIFVSLLMVRRRVSLLLVVGLCTLCTGGLLGAIVGGVFPDCYLVQTGLTEFNIAAEIVICCVMVLSAMLLHRYRSEFSDVVYYPLLASLLVTIMQESAFSLYVDVYGLFNFLGHCFKVLSCYLLFEAMVRYAIIEPNQLLFRRVWQAEEATLEAKLQLENNVEKSAGILRDRNQELIREVATREDALRQVKESRARLSLALSAAKAGVWSWDVKSGMVVFDQRMAEIMGVDAHAFDGQMKTWRECLLPADVEKFVAFSMEALQNHDAREIEFRVPIKDTMRIVRCSAVVVRDSENWPIRMNGMCMDITEYSQPTPTPDRAALCDKALAELSLAFIEPRPDMSAVVSQLLQRMLVLTESRHGYISTKYVGSDGNVLHSLSTMSPEGQCQIKEHSFVLAQKESEYRSLWGYSLKIRKAFYTNHPHDYVASRGVPVGHIPISRFLSVPLFLDGDLVGQIALINFTRDFHDDDIETMQPLAEMFCQLLRHHRVPCVQGADAEWEPSGG
ncbi:MASE3 domain-containing protein [Desulfovibrio inopinatus]|uniref:MASE3 domain-containing protein n=1 Tax=Desulfovibrio inopinatus TaxID=102109 RepID=UPI000415DA9C|nr:MASE3 domain-containing protein [Desulfovibrio inopinatus]